MKSDISLTNVSFDFLRNSNDFLNILLSSLNSCVLLLDNKMRLVAFNDALKTIFSNRKDEDLLYVKCGEAIGCAYQIEERKKCGETSRCCSCDLRVAALQSYMNNETIYKDQIIRPFFNSENTKVDKHIQFSTRIFRYQEEKYIMMLVEDVSKYLGV